MHVVLVHDALIPPRAYGGTERVLHALAKALIELGHRVTLIAQPGSRVPGAEIIALKAGAPWVASVPADADILHLSATPSETLPKPFLVTIHGNGKPGEQFHPNTVFLSRKHATLHHSSHFVHNGLDFDEVPCDPRREPYAVFLAKASWSVKNLDGAIELARAARLPLEVLGSRDLPFNLNRHLPRWKGVRYHGMVEEIEKREILRKAKALFFPVRWHEPFGLAVIEALASGTPVFATPYGSLPELINPDVGFLSASATEHLTALQSLKFSPEKCRQRALHHFSHREMARNYVSLYSRVLSEGSLGKAVPYAPEADPQALLAWHGLAP